MAYSLIAAGVALFIAIFHEQLRTLFLKPQLKISIEINDPADCHKTTIKKTKITDGTTSIETADCYYFRLSIINQGSASAENVEVIIESVEKMNQASNAFEVWKQFLPLNLIWAYSGEIFFPRILGRGLKKHCDLAYIIDPSRLQVIEERDMLLSRDEYANKKVLVLCFRHKPFTGTYILEPGKYRLGIAVAAANARPVRETVEINFLDWFQDERTMLKDGIDIRIM